MINFKCNYRRQIFKFIAVIERKMYQSSTLQNNVIIKKQ